MENVNQNNDPQKDTIGGMSVVPVADLRAQYVELKEEIDRAVGEVLESGRYILGDAVEAFEEEMRSFLCLEGAFGCANGTDALILALMACGLKTGDEVMLPAFSFVAPAEAIVHCGAIPRFVDVDPMTFNIDPEAIERDLTDRTKAIVVVHLFGQCADMRSVLETAESRGIRVIEDVAQSFGAYHRGNVAGSMGDVCCFSFYPTKNLGCMGDGGMVGTRNTGFRDKLDYLRNHGEVEKYRHAMVGMNSRLDEIQAAILRVKFPLVEKWNARRVEIAAMYESAFADLDIQLPAVLKGNTHVYHQYTLRLVQRDAVAVHLKERNISTAVHYPLPIPFQPAYTEYTEGKGRYPVASMLAKEVLSLPIYPQMSNRQVERVIDGVRTFFRSS